MVKEQIYHIESHPIFGMAFCFVSSHFWDLQYTLYITILHFPLITVGYDCWCDSCSLQLLIIKDEVVVDIVRDKKVSFVKRNRLVFMVVVTGAIAFFLTQTVATTSFTTDKSKLTIAEVEQGDFTIKVRGPGVLTPKEFRWIASDVNGRAERVLVKPGAQVKAGDLLIELTNPILERKLEETRWELEAQEAETTAGLVALDSQLLDQKARVFNARLDFETVAMRLKAEKELFDSGAQVVSKLDFEKTKLQNRQTKERWSIEQQREEKMRENVAAQKNALHARLNKMRKTLESMQEQVDNLQVKASIDSVVQVVAVEAGQQVVLGSNLAKLAQQDELLAELQIPELAIRDVVIGQEVTIDTRNNKIIGQVIRIAPAVNNGAVQVDVELSQPLPNDARPDLSIDGEILVAHLPNALFVRRPPFAQSNRTTTLFKVNPQQDSAQRISVEFGRGSVQKIQILNGLAVGEKIIISQNEDIQRFDNIALK